MKGESHKIWNYQTKYINQLYMFAKAEAKDSIKQIQHACNIKFNAHLKLIDDEEFEWAKFKIRLLYFEKREIMYKLGKYHSLF